MSKKNTLVALDPSISYAVIGLDLAKADVAVAAVPCSDDEIGLIDRMDYESLYEQAAKLEPTLFAMEPCCGYSTIALRLESLGHQVKVISGNAVKHWVATHRSSQKTDLNDATALAKLALNDSDLRPIRVKNLYECRIASIQASRRQLSTQATATLVCFKSLCQSWGVVIPKGSKSIKKLTDTVDANVELLGIDVANTFKRLLENYKRLNAEINAMDKALQKLVQQDERGRLMQSVLGIGTQTAARLLVVTGEIVRFENSRSYVAYFGLAPRNIISGHCGTPDSRRRNQAVYNRGQGKVSRRGDKIARSLIIQGAGSIYMLNCKNQLQECQLKRWLDQQMASRKAYGKIIVSLAAKLLRIIWALLTRKEEFDIHKAGVSRSVLAAMEKPVQCEVTAESAV